MRQLHQRARYPRRPLIDTGTDRFRHLLAELRHLIRKRFEKKEKGLRDAMLVVARSLAYA